MIYESLSSNEPQKFRGKISNETNIYYIVNELSNLPYMKTLSAVKLIKTEKASEKTYAFESEIYCLAYFEKKYIEKIVFDNNPKTVDEMSIFYQNLKQNFVKYSKVKREYILELFDYIETPTGIFYVMEAYDQSLHDYLLEVRQEKFIKTNECEVLFRSFFTTILTGIASMHEESLHFCGLIDKNDIYLKSLPNHQMEIKLLHPLLSDLLTLLKIYSNNLPSFFAPELYKLFQQRQNVTKQLDCYHSFETVHTMLRTFPNSIFDYWSAGFLFYEMIFGKMPFKINSLEQYTDDLNKDKTYEMEWPYITEKMEKIISGCLIYKVEKRLTSGLIEKTLRDMIKENIDEVKKEIKERSKEHSKEKRTYTISY